MELTLKEVEFQKINLAPGDTLFIQMTGDEFTNNPEQVDYFRSLMQKSFPDNKVLIMAIPSGNKVEIGSIKEAPGCGVANYCVDCNCGKKEGSV